MFIPRNIKQLYSHIYKTLNFIIVFPSILLLLIANGILSLGYIYFFSNLKDPFNRNNSDMNSFLRQARKLLTLQEPLLVVLSNESCDLDSAVSAISLAYYYSQTSETKSGLTLSSDERNRILPMLNIPRKFLPTKTEVTYFLKRHQIDIENVVCRDEIPEALFESSKLILVDHHVSPFKSSVVQVIDHRPLDTAAGLSRNCSVNIQQVASCTTLIADLILQENPSSTQLELLKFLYPVIVLDSVNFSPGADKARPLDFFVSDRIASALNISKEDNKHMFDDLVKARADVSTLDSLQILSKDMKRVVCKHNNQTIVTIPGFPISVMEYIKMTDASLSLLTFANDHNCSIVILMGMKVIDQLPQRDLAVIKVNDNDQQLFSQIVSALQASDELQLVEVKDIDFLGGHFYQQQNVKGSRKQVLPIVQEIVDSFVQGS